MPLKSILVEISPGEMIDKITILLIKSECIKDAEQLANVQHELGVLSAQMDKNIPSSQSLNALISELKAVNEELWRIEDDIRDCERTGDYSQLFIDLARSVYITNDKRADLKRKINLLLGSKIMEEKSYQPY
jgi:chaperonin cofactor prefoldin